MLNMNTYIYGTVLVAAVYGCFKIYSLSAEVKEVTSELNIANIKLEEITAAYTAEKKSSELKDKTVSSVNYLLNKCYSDLKHVQNSYGEIDKIMSGKTEGIPVKDIKRISPVQENAGMEFVNKQISRLDKLE